MLSHVESRKWFMSHQNAYWQWVHNFLFHLLFLLLENVWNWDDWQSRRMQLRKRKEESGSKWDRLVQLSYTETFILVPLGFSVVDPLLHFPRIIISLPSESNLISDQAYFKLELKYKFITTFELFRSL